MLDEKLIAYAKTDIYPFHMPGHKRRLSAGTDPYAIDITEIDGFDNLHRAGGVLLEAQQRAAALYGSKKAYYLINGSTCGILAAISAAVPRGGEVIAARNCHKAVYHAFYLMQLTVHYLYPPVTKEGIACAVSQKDVEQAIREHPDASAVILTSPTYDGVVSDISAIADAAHRGGAVLIVDEAHGAHFGIDRQGNDPPFPKSAVTCGADLVVQSLHKTLPSFTQTALLHLCSNRVESRRVEQYLDIYETSSPSYVLMAGMERCIRMMTEDGAELLRALRTRIDAFAGRMESLKNLRLLGRGDFLGGQAYDFDASKLLIYTGDTDITGKQLYDVLLHEYHLQMEMASGNYVLAMCGVTDEEGAFMRLFDALSAIDQSLSKKKSDGPLPFSVVAKEKEQVLSIAEAVDKKARLCSPAEAIGEIAADYLYLYPPGIPLLAPGERITEELIKDVSTCMEAGLEVCGLREVPTRSCQKFMTILY